MPEQKKTRAELKSLFSENSIPTADDFAALIDSGLNRTDDQVDVTTAGTVEAKIIQARTDSEQGWLSLKGAGDNNGVRITGNSFLRANKISTWTSNSTLTLYGEGTGFVQVDDRLSVTGGLDVTGAAVTIGTTTANQPLTVNGNVSATGNLMSSGGWVRANNLMSYQANTNLALFADGTGIVTVGTATADDELYVYGPLTTKGRIISNNGLEVKGAGVTIGVAASGSGTTAVPAALQPLTVNGTTTVTGTLFGTTISGTPGTNNLVLKSVTENGVVMVGTATVTDIFKVFGPATFTKGDVTIGAAGSGTGTTAVPTEERSLRVYGSITASNGLTVSGTTSTGVVNAGGKVTANAGLDVKGAGVTIGVAAVPQSGTTPAVVAALQPLTVNGSITATDGLTVSGGTTTVGVVKASGKISANNGLEVSGANLLVSNNNQLWVNIITSHWGDTNLMLSAQGTGIVVVDDKLSVTGGLEVKGAPVTIGVAASGSGTTAVPAALQPLTVNGLISANAGLNVTGAALTIGSATAGQSLILNGVSITKIVTTLDSATDDTTTIPTTRSIRERIAAGNSSSALTAGANISPGTVTASGLVTANAGLTVTGAGVTIGTTTSNQPLTLNGNLTVNGTVTVRDASPLVWTQISTHPAYYAKTLQGMVHLRGEIRTLGTSVTGGYRIAALPAGFLPETDTRVVTIAGSNYTSTEFLRITTGGSIIATSNAVPVVLDGISFQAATDSLRLHLPLSGNPNDLSRYRWSPAATDITWASNDAKFPNCAVFNGTSSYIALAGISCPEEFTLSVWTQRLIASTSPNLQTIMTFTASPHFHMIGAKPYLATGIFGSDLSTGSWHHLAVTRTLTGTTIYVDGSSNLNTPTAVPSCGSSCMIGASQVHSSLRIYYFTGNMAQLQVYSRVLTDAEISTLYNNPTATLP